MPCCLPCKNIIMENNFNDTKQHYIVMAFVIVTVENVYRGKAIQSVPKPHVIVMTTHIIFCGLWNAPVNGTCYARLFG